MKKVTATELRGNIYKILDEVLETGVPLEIEKGGRMLRLSAVEAPNKLDNLISRPEVYNCDPDDLADVHWDEEVKLDLP